jgi:hypothetical protein
MVVAADLPAGKARRKVEAFRPSGDSGVVRAIRTLGIVIGVIGGLFTLLKAYADLNASTRRDLREQISASVKFYDDAADRAIRLSTSQTASQGDLMLTSLQQAVLKPPPTLDGGMLNPVLKKNIQAGFTEVCQSRRYSIETHYAAADSETRARLATFTESPSVSKAAADFQAQCGELIKASAASGLQSLNNVAPPVTTINKAAISPSGWDVDVPFCPGRSNLALAEQLAKALAVASDAGQPIGGQRLGRIRTREGQGAAGNVIYFDPKEEALASSLSRYATDLTGQPFTVEPNRGAATPWYLSIFVCGQNGRGH